MPSIKDYANYSLWWHMGDVLLDIWDVLLSTFKLICEYWLMSLLFVLITLTIPISVPVIAYLRRRQARQLLSDEQKDI